MGEMIENIQCLLLDGRILPGSVGPITNVSQSIMDFRGSYGYK